MVANTPNGRTPHIGGGIALLPPGPNGKKQGADDLIAQGWTWNDIQAFIYPMHEVFDMDSGEFSPAPGLSPPPAPNPVYESGGADRRGLPTISLKEFLRQTPEPYEWVVEGLLAKGNITILAGAPKESGKTTLLMDTLSNVVEGAPWLGRATTKADILYCTEQGNNLLESMQMTGLDDPNIEGFDLLPVSEVFDWSWADILREIAAACEEKSYGLIVIDTLVEFADFVGDDENSSGKVKAALRPLKMLAEKYGVAIVVTQHHNVRGVGRGSTQFRGAVDFILDLYPVANNDEEESTDPNIRRLKGVGRSHLVPDNLLICLTEEGYELVSDTTENNGIKKNTRRVLRAVPWLEFEARAVNEIKESLESAGHSMGETTIRRHLDELEKKSFVQSKGGSSSKDPLRFWRTEPDQPSRAKLENDDELITGESSSAPPLSNTGFGGGGADNVVPIRPDVPVETPAMERGTAQETLAEKFNYIYTEKHLADCQEWAMQQPYMSIDIETKGKNKNESLLYTKATIRLIALHAEDESWFIDCNHLTDENVSSLLKELEDKPKYFHNSAFDVPRIYRRFGVLLNQNVRDTLIASRAARAGEWEENGNKRPKIGHDLADCLKRELGIEIPKVKQKWSGPLTDEHLLYAGDDVAHLKGLYNVLYERIEGLGIKIAYDAIAGTMHMFLESAALGVPVDAAMLEAIQTEVSKEKDELQNELNKLAPEHPEGLEWKWRNSDKDTHPEGKGRAGVHRMLQLVGMKLSNLEEQTLLDSRDKHPLVKTLYKYRKVASAYSKYHRYLSDFYEYGRLYPQVKIAGAVTGRVLYAEPNIQGMDKKKTDKYRKCIRAEEGYYIVKGDFAQQELRIAAYFSGDEDLMAAFTNGEDVYMRVARKIAGKHVEHGTKEGDNARAAAKRAVLGYLYGLGTTKYRENVYKDTGVEISEEEAERDREAFRAAYPGFYRWQRRHGSYKDEANLPKEDMWETRSVRGWRRVVEGNYERKSVWKKEHGVAAAWVPKYTERLNGGIQSTAGDVLYLTLGKLDTDLSSGLYPSTRFLFTAHDEVALTCPESDARDVAAWLKSRMVEAFEEVLGPELGGPASVEVGGGPSWGEIEECV